MATRDVLTADERAVLVALLGAGAALTVHEVAARVPRAEAPTVHEHLTSLRDHGLVAHTGDGWGLTPHGRALAAELADD